MLRVWKWLREAWAFLIGSGVSAHRERCMNAVAVLNWTFSPPDYFEEAIEILHQDYTMTIGDGHAQARVDSAIYEANSDMRERLCDVLTGQFLSVQMVSHRAYELSSPTMTITHPNGRRDVFVEVQPARAEAVVGKVDFRITDKDGNITVDSRRDRIEKQKRLAKLITTYLPGDTVLASLFRSKTAAAHDPDNELVHLYEIRDALSAKFGGDTATRTSLGISRAQWSRLGALCNDEPLRQGRHRGENAGALRDASEAELIEARGIAQAMIEAYLQHLEASANP
jgi:hypothetical protein